MKKRFGFFTIGALFTMIALPVVFIFGPEEPFIRDHFFEVLVGVFILSFVFTAFAISKEKS